MVPSDKKDLYDKLRRDYPVFTYAGCHLHHSRDIARLQFSFHAGNAYVFEPRWQINFGKYAPQVPSNNAQDKKWAFYLGMIEMVSYWKAFCSPAIEVAPGSLSEEEKEWWFKLYQYGLGEFFYTNGIDIPGKEMLRFRQKEDTSLGHSEKRDTLTGTRDERVALHDSILVPVGGGKDSVVTLELLKQAGYKVVPFVVNPRGATKGVLSRAGFAGSDIITMERTIEPLLLHLNAQGFLNGHTPFSALLAFVSAFVASKTGIKHIALSNESSANEPSVPGTIINHQYSKSLEFEKDFRAFAARHIKEDISYYSLLRPLNELQIGALFSRYSRYHDVFKSCNAGSKTDRWCCECAKCLFTYVILSPFMPQEKLQGIFGENLFENEALLSMLFDLSGEGPNKPFECVGTTKEVNLALAYTCRQLEGKGRVLPPLLLSYKKSHLYQEYSRQSVKGHLEAFDEDHCLEKDQEELVKNAVSNAGRALI